MTQKKPNRRKSSSKAAGRKSAARVQDAANDGARTAAKAAPQAQDKLSDTKRKGTKAMMTQGKANFDKLSQDCATAGREQVEAIVKSGNIFAKGFEDLFKTYVSLAQSATERNVEAFKTLLGSRTLNEFTETQSRVAQENLDGFLSGVTKISELGVRVATETLEPINDQVSKSMKKASEAAAA